MAPTEFSRRRGRSTFDELVEVLGEEVALRLCARLGGLEVYVPRVLDGGHLLVVLLGAGPADRLVQRFGGGALEVPAGREHFTRLRHERVRELLRAGASVAEVAARTGFSRQSVRRLRRRFAARCGG